MKIQPGDGGVNHTRIRIKKLMYQIMSLGPFLGRKTFNTSIASPTSTARIPLSRRTLRQASGPTDWVVGDALEEGFHHARGIRRYRQIPVIDASGGVKQARMIALAVT